ncbi:sulfatase family protein [Pelagicoccus mobilis]|uniref:Sulfatase n=1 Tax=Pelagicoccus mobilis TaxID=415221 RepID=A0A934RSZ0_9BACT|nr:sulfatase [Pelagicoccus mobilis]MBK1875863.1 sulfatase [Pelagicoccus mobilis]
MKTKRFRLTLLATMWAVLGTLVLYSAERPNILWLTSEDNSVHYLRLYSEGGAPMPTVERLAESGLVFEHAFSNAPVCSTARSTIISSCYGPRLFSQHHRREELVPMPEGLRMFPWYLRQAGYYTSNNYKEDYNFIKSDGVWDDSSRTASYRNREEGQPFFHVQNFHTTHEGRLHFNKKQMANRKTKTDPKTVPVFPIHPDTETFRYTNAYYRDLHLKVDREMGAFLKQLEEDGLMDDTIIFYYGDHGGVLPGSKGYAYERGLHVPMVVYAPEKWKHLLPTERGSRVEGFVEFVDLGPTVLNLAGVEVPEKVDGEAFLGKGVELGELNQRNRAFAYADRFDEKYDLVRTLRIGNFKYMRNFQPYNFDGLQNNYRYKSLAYKEWRKLYNEGKLNEAQKLFFEPRPAEALYNLDTDPFELNNLAEDPAYASDLLRLRKELQAQLKGMPDLGFYPESFALEKFADNPEAYGQARQEAIARLIDVADLSLLPFEKAQKRIVRALASKNPWKRYWGLIVCSSFGEEAKSFAAKAQEMAKQDDTNLVRARAAEFLALIKEENPSSVLQECLRNSKTLPEASLVLNTAVLLKDLNLGYQIDLDRNEVPADWLEDKLSNVLRRFDYLDGKL